MSQTKVAEQGVAQQDATSQEQVLQLPINILVEYKGHPFNILNDDAMNELVQNITTHGVVTPIIVRKQGNGLYEIISGHRRVHASKRAGLETVPAIVKELDDDQAAILMVDTNLQQRDRIAPSERGRAYKLKMEVLTHQGRRSNLATSDQVGTKLAAGEVADEWGTSKTQVHRYIRLTYLNSDILVYVDKEEMGLTTAVELSYLSEIEQKELLMLFFQNAIVYRLGRISEKTEVSRIMQRSVPN